MAGARRRAGIVLTLFFLLQIAMPLCSGYEPQGVPSTIKTPQDIEKWFSSLKSQMTLPDVPQTVQEMLESRAGDCDDFATLASKILADLGISSEVLVIQYTGTPLRHAICLWVDENGNYNFFSAQRLVRTGESDKGAVLGRYFPSAENFTVLDISQRVVA